MKVTISRMQKTTKQIAKVLLKTNLKRNVNHVASLQITRMANKELRMARKKLRMANNELKKAKRATAKETKRRRTLKVATKSHANNASQDRTSQEIATTQSLSKRRRKKYRFLL